MDASALPLVNWSAVAAKGCFVYCYLRAKDSSTGKAGSPFYVGFSSGARRPVRQQNHICGVPKDRRLIRVLRSGMTAEEAFDWERFYIARYGRKMDGGILANMSLGGEGNLGGTHTPEFRERISRRHKGVPKSPEHSAKVAAALKGKKKSPEHCAALKAANSKPWLGRRHSEETKAKMSAALTGRKRPSEFGAAHGRRCTERAAARYGLTFEQYTTLSRQHRINMSSWLKRKEGRTPLQYVELFGQPAS